MRITLVWIGKTRHPATAAMAEMVLGRMRAFARSGFAATVTGEELAGREPERSLLRRAQGARFWLLDPAGRSFDSPGFARFLEREAATFPQEMLLAIGGADGFPPELHAVAAGKISLSPLTLSHELARLVALEQIYRALAILNHHPYPH